MNKALNERIKDDSVIMACYEHIAWLAYCPSRVKHVASQLNK